jgi:RNA polymerase sigma factor (sigma-70 family)
MHSILSLDFSAPPDQPLSDAIQREQARLRRFIRKRVVDPRDAEDILQDVFYEFVEMARLAKPVEKVSAWLFQVARNRITDLFRKRSSESLRVGPITATAEGAPLPLEDLLPSPGAGPEAAYARSILMEELDAALDELPGEQREVFIAHELEGRSFKELAAQTGASPNALRLRKHYAVTRLRRRLQFIYDEFTKGNTR